MRYIHSLLILFVLWLTPPGQAQEINPSAEKLKVAVMLIEPFCMKGENGYSGITVDIWKQIAAENHWEYEFTEHTEEGFKHALKALSKSEYDVLIGPTSSSAERETIVDFSRPYFIDYVGAITKGSFYASLVRIIETFVYTAGALLIILGLFFLLHIHLIWYFERKHTNIIPRSYWKGLNFILWYQLSKNNYSGTPHQQIPIPKSPHARTSLIFWIATTYILTTLISGTIVSFMTVSLSRSDIHIRSEQDLKGKVVGAIEGTNPYSLAKRLGFKTLPLNNFKEGIQKLENSQISAFISDHSIAVYRLQKILNTNIILSPLVLEYDLYAFALPKKSPLKDQINDSLIKLHNDGTILGLCREYIPGSIMNCRL